MSLTRREFLGTAIAGAAAALSGCPSVPSYEAAFSRSDFETRVHAYHRAFKSRVEAVPQRMTIGRAALFVQEGTKDDERALDFLVDDAVQAASGASSDVEKLAAMHTVFAERRPFKNTYFFRDTVSGRFSDCGTRALLFIEAAERMRSPVLSFVRVQGHAYLRIDHNPAKNWETTASRRQLFTVQDDLHPVEYKASDVLDESLVMHAIHSYKHAVGTGDSDVTIDALAKSAGIARLVARGTQEKYNSYDAHAVLGDVYFQLGCRMDDSFYTEMARTFYERAHNLTGNPSALLALEQTYRGKDGSKEDKTMSLRILSRASVALVQKKDELRPVLVHNPLLFYKTAAVYTDMHIKIHQRIAEVSLQPETVRMIERGLPCLQQERSFYEKLYCAEVAQRTRVESVHVIGEKLPGK